MAYESQYDQKVNDLYGKLENREPFVYNAADDQLYQQYVDRYQNMGRKAMMDTVGQGAALTGGYTNSYAQNVGQQAYDEYLQGLNDKLMETYQLAYNQYQDRGNDMYNLFNAAGTLAGNDFNRYMQEQQLQLQRDQFEWQKANSGRSGGGGGGGGSSKTKDEDDDKPEWDIRYLGNALSAIKEAGGSTADQTAYINDYAEAVGANEAQQKYAAMLASVMKYGMN